LPKVVLGDRHVAFAHHLALPCSEPHVRLARINAFGN
jgi:hypothetical protein